jgi:diaminohydroxyphosphoribosylaminopyrimidine deaminase/5-amino-6-(5-phosphoribosylamino)uracil reductase
VRIDNPMLTARLGDETHQPTRVVLSNDLNFDLKLSLWDTSQAKTLVLTQEGADFSQKALLKGQGVEISSCAIEGDELNLVDAFFKLGSLGFTSVLVEPGQKLFHNLLLKNLVDEIWWFKSPDEIGPDGLHLNFDEQALTSFNFEFNSSYSLGVDRLSIFSKV